MENTLADTTSDVAHGGGVDFLLDKTLRFGGGFATIDGSATLSIDAG